MYKRAKCKMQQNINKKYRFFSKKSHNFYSILIIDIQFVLYTSVECKYLKYLRY